MLEFLVGNDFLSTIIAFALVLIPAVIIHELGHFLAAKAVGITVLEFGVGFPPRLARLFTWGETEFTLNLLPLGGFVRPLGEDLIRPLSEEETRHAREKLLNQIQEKQGKAAAERDVEGRAKQPTLMSEREELAARGITEMRSVNEVRPLPRILFLTAGALANFISAIVVFVLVGLLGVPQEVGVRIQLIDVEAGSTLAQAGLLPGDAVETINGEYFQANRDFFRMLAQHDGEDVTIGFLRPGAVGADGEREMAAMTATLTADAAEAERYASASGRLHIISILEDSPAKQAGMQPDDLVIAFGGEDLGPAEDPFLRLQALSRELQGTPTTVTVLRDGETLTLDVTPRVDPPPQLGRLGISLTNEFSAGPTAYINASAVQEFVPLTFGESLAYGFERMNGIVSQITQFPARLLAGQTQPGEERVISMVGVSQLGGTFLQESIENDRPTLILDYIAVISIALGITNLLPIPALDGGRVLFVLVEIVRGRPIPPEREGVIHMIGLALLLSLGVIVILNDLINPVTNLLP